MRHQLYRCCAVVLAVVALYLNNYYTGKAAEFIFDKNSFPQTTAVSFGAAAPPAATTVTASGGVNNDSVDADPRSGRLQVLCTSKLFLMSLGSFECRCIDFERLTKQYYPTAKIDIHILSRSGLKKKVRRPFDVTIMVKAVFKRKPIFGKRILVDVVDEYNLHGEGTIPAGYEVIVQNKYQAMEFPNRTTHIVPHWFISFPDDDKDDPPSDTYMDIEPVEDKTLRALTVWQSRALTVWQGGGGCYKISNPLFQYDCISGDWDISRWYTKYTSGDPPGFMRRTLDDPRRGPAYLYRHLYRKYHVLVVYPKGGLKLKFNCLQRIVTQMRSGVPVLVSCRGESHNEFCHKYNYPCVFHDEESFSTMMHKMRDVQLRKECQRLGIEITRDYTPRIIVKQYLDLLGVDFGFTNGINNTTTALDT